MTLRVLHCLINPGVGGLERVVELLVLAQRDAGRDVQVASFPDFRRPPAPVVAALREAGVPLHEIAVPPRSYLATLRAIRALARRVGAGVLHTHGYFGDVVGGLAARAHLPRVSTVHGFAGGDWKNRMYERLQVVALRHYDAVVSVSAPLARDLASKGVPAHRIHTVVNAWRAGPAPVARAAARERLGISAAGPLIGYVGRLSHEKGADQLLAALARCSGEWRAVIVGDGPERAALEGQAAALGLSDRVHFLGLVPNAGSLVGAFDALALPSRTEGTPMVLFEAMEARVPIVAFGVGGVPLVLEGPTGWTVSPGDIGAFADALQQVLVEPEMARARSELAIQRLRSEYSDRAWVDRYDSVYAVAARAFGQVKAVG